MVTDKIMFEHLVWAGHEVTRAQAQYINAADSGAWFRVAECRAEFEVYAVHMVVVLAWLIKLNAREVSVCR